MTLAKMSDYTRYHFLAAIFIFFVVCAEFSAESRAAWNAARFKPATQISEYDAAHPATLGNDGDRGNDSSQCVRTGVTNRPWWQVDLQGQFTVESVVLTVSDDIPPVLTDFFIDVYDKDSNLYPISNNSTCLSHYGPLNGSRLTCITVVKGRYVRIYSHNNNGYLKFCEMEVIVSETRSLMSYFTANKESRIQAPPMKSEKVTARSLIGCAVRCKEHTEPWACNALHWDTTSANCELLMVDPRSVNQTSFVQTKGVSFYIEKTN